MAKKTFNSLHENNLIVVFNVLKNSTTVEKVESVKGDSKDYVAINDYIVYRYSSATHIEDDYTNMWIFADAETAKNFIQTRINILSKQLSELNML